MECKSYNVAAPGSLMLFGEHAVLHGKQAISCAINQYIKVRLIPRQDNKIEILSKSFGSYSTSLGSFKITKKYNYVLTAIKQYLSKIKSGFSLEIYAGFPSDVGFGSSAAVIVATLGALNLWTGKKDINLMRIYREGVLVVHEVAGLGSGADIAASIFGGVIAYKIKPVSIKRLVGSLPLVAVYSGSKVPTKDVIANVERSCKKFPKVYSGLYSVIDNCTKEAILAIKRRSFRRLGELMSIHHGLQDALGVNNNILSEIIFSLSSKPGIFGAKISGSGFGDSVVGLGKIKKNIFPENKTQKKIGVKQFDIGVSKIGLHEIIGNPLLPCPAGKDNACC